ncbi:DUF5134 domain-containing protein [Streptomyces sp. NPDC092296]|uniref:DUF5134 domain-containing protein n=1 Tax=Streptomyces sp. NPDC092296 TaxID=3366012 RepID=UPI0037F6274B
MHGAPLLGWLLAALTGAAGLYCLALLCAPAPRSGCAGGAESAAGAPRGAAARESDAAEALMGLGMAVMAVPLAEAGGVPVAAWAVVFGGTGAWFALAALRGGDARRRAHRLHHAVGAGAMVYMALAMAGGGGHPAGPGMAGELGMADMAGTAEGPLLTGLLLVYFGGHALWTGSRLLRPPGGPVALAVGGGGGWAPLRVPGLPQACRLVMGLGMFAMLLMG